LSRFLASLPHQIPFRAASDATVVDDRTVEGTFLWTANDALGAAPEVMLVEAMAQVGGSLVFRDAKSPGFLSAIDDACIRGPIAVGDRLTLRVTLDASFGRIFRMSGLARNGETEAASARFYLASSDSGE
jgi:hypothetical protein